MKYPNGGSIFAFLFMTTAIANEIGLLETLVSYAVALPILMLISWGITNHVHLD